MALKFMGSYKKENFLASAVLSLAFGLAIGGKGFYNPAIVGWHVPKGMPSHSERELYLLRIENAQTKDEIWREETLPPDRNR